MNNYFIKEGYITNRPLIYRTDEDYDWNSKRINRNLNANYAVYKWAKKVATANKVKSILDIGCGPGIKLNHFFIRDKDFNVTAVDNLQAVSFCKANYPSAKFSVLDLSSETSIKPLAGEPFDMIICVDVIEHLENPLLLLNMIKCNSNMNTIIILSTPERDIVRGKNAYYSPNKDHIREWTRSEMNLFLKNNGFTTNMHLLTNPIRFNISTYYFKHLLYYYLRMKPFKGTQVVIMKTINE